MNLLPMQYYLAVTEEESISGAAAKLHITQQTLSAHIAALEKELGCTLFLRKPRFALTYAGRVFRAYAVRFDDLYRAMSQEFRDLAGEAAGELSVGVAYTRGRFLLTPLLAAYRKTHPGVRIRLVESTNEDLIARLRGGEVDLIFANLTEARPPMAAKLFAREEIVLLVPDALLSARGKSQIKRGDFRPLAACPFLMNRREDVAGRVGGAFLEKHGIVPRVAVTSENLETLLDLCLAGEGACFCSKELAAKAFAGREASHLLRVPLDAKFSIHVAWLEKPYLRKALADFLRLSEREARKMGLTRRC